MATKTDIELKIVDSVDTSHTDAEVLADSASNPDAFYVGRGYLAKGGEKVIENIDKNGTYPNVTVGNATKAATATTADKAVKDGGGKNIAENYALISDTVGKLGVLNSPVDRSATIPNALTNAWGIDNTMFSVIIYERANSSATWVEKWNYATASFVQKTQVERGEATSNLFISTRGYQVKVKVVVSTTTSNYIKALNLNIKTKDGTYSGNVDYTAYYGSSLTVAYNGSMGTWGANWGASFLEAATQNVEYIFNANRANASIVIRGYRICTNEPTNPTLIGKALKAYEADKATTADTATRANTAATAATAVNISDAPVLTATEDEQITVKVGNKTSNALTVPYAQRADFATDLSGRVEATPEVFTYRPSAGDKSIKDDNAFIRRVKGNSVVFNQFIAQYTRTSNGVTITDSNGVYSLSGIATESYFQMVYIPSIPKGHKFLIFCEILANPNNLSFQFGDLNCSGSYFNPAQTNSIIYTVAENTLANHAIGFTSYPANADFTGVKLACNVHDLTAMFGTGNEPSTVEEFRALYPNSYYPYNTGELRNLVCSGIKTVGFNLVDKNNFLTGVIAGSSDTPSQTQKSDYRYIKVPVFPNTEYYLKDVSNLYHYYSYILYDSNMNRIKAGGIVVRDSYPYNISFVITTPSNAAYMIVNVHKDFVDTCCVNLHHTGYRDGEYTPYKEVTHSLPLSQITNGEPLRKAGSVYDEINETEYIRRVGVVDLGSLGWGVNDASKNVFWTATKITDATVFGYSAQPNLTCRIDVLPFSEISGTKKCVSMHDAQQRIVICAPDFEATEAGASALKASLSGVLLHYELAEPIVTPIETPIDFNYYVEDFGTEEAILAENSAPFSADIIYQFNATDQVRNNSRNIQRLQKSVFTPSGTTAQYIRGDGSYADVSELASVIPINGGEGEGIDNEDGGQNLEFRLFPQYYAKSVYTADADMYKEVIIRVEAPDNTDFVAEYWFELEIGESIPPIRFENQDNVGTSFRFNGEIRTDAVNIWHLITTDGGTRYFGEIKSYLTE